MADIVNLSKKLFYDRLKKYPLAKGGYYFHVPEVERWARIILQKNPDIDAEVVLVAVWLHDIGSFPHTKQDHARDHAVAGMRIANVFLKKHHYDAQKTRMILHCIRAHRCRDVKPKTKEAKCVACSDSASHLTDYVYLRMMIDARTINDKQLAGYARDKLERDYDDLSFFPHIQKELTPLYLAWKRLLSEYHKI